MIIRSFLLPMKKEHDPFYDSARWKHLRSRVLRRDGYQCQLTKRMKMIPKQAQVVHHIFPREFYPEYQWEAWNLISLTKAMHNSLHDRDSDRLTFDGMALLKRTARKMQIRNVDELLERMK